MFEVFEESVAANEKGNRNLKGYVRCKMGNVGETYLRKNAVPANVALVKWSMVSRCVYSAYS